MTRRINAEGLKLVKQWEGVKLTAYKDVAAVWTIGYGSTGAHVIPGMTISAVRAERLLMDDLDRFERAVERLVKVNLNDNQFAALVSFAFNVGEGKGGFATSTLLKKLNAGNYDAVPGELMKWVNAGGKKVQGLVNRRAAEAGLWARGSFVSSNTVEAKPAKPPVVIAALLMSFADTTTYSTPSCVTPVWPILRLASPTVPAISAAGEPRRRLAHPLVKAVELLVVLAHGATSRRGERGGDRFANRL